MSNQDEHRVFENYEAVGEACLCCGRMGDGLVCYHHVKTRGSNGSDDHRNLMPLCLTHHSEVHQLGLSYMVEKYRAVKPWLIEKEWEWCTLTRKWRNYKIAFNLKAYFKKGEWIVEKIAA